MAAGLGDTVRDLSSVQIVTSHDRTPVGLASLPVVLVLLRPSLLWLLDTLTASASSSLTDECSSSSTLILAGSASSSSASSGLDSTALSSSSSSSSSTTTWRAFLLAGGDGSSRSDELLPEADGAGEWLGDWKPPIKPNRLLRIGEMWWWCKSGMANPAARRCCCCCW